MDKFIKGIVFISNTDIDCPRFTDFHDDGIGWIDKPSKTYVEWTHTKNHNQIDRTDVWGSKKYLFSIFLINGIVHYDIDNVPSELEWTEQEIKTKGANYFRNIHDAKGVKMDIKDFNKLKKKAKDKNISLSDAYKMKDEKIVKSYIYYNEIDDVNWLKNACQSKGIKLQDLGDKYLLTGTEDKMRGLLFTMEMNYDDCVFDSVKDNIDEQDKDLFKRLLPQLVDAFKQHYHREPNDEEIDALRKMAVAGVGVGKAMREIKKDSIKDSYVIAVESDNGESLWYSVELHKPTSDWNKATKFDNYKEADKVRLGLGSRFYSVAKADSIKDYSLSESDTSIIDDAIYWVKKNNQALTIANVLAEIESDMSGFLGNNKNAVIDYLRKKGIRDAKPKDAKNNVQFLGGMFEFVEGDHREIQNNKNKILPIQQINEILLREDRKAYGQNNGQGYDKCWVDLIFSIDGKKYRYHGGRLDLGDGVRYGKDKVQVSQSDIDDIRRLYENADITEIKSMDSKKSKDAKKDNLKLWRVSAFSKSKEYQAETGQDAVAMFKKDFPNVSDDDIYVQLIRTITNNTEELISRNMDSIKDVKPRADESKNDFIARFMNETKAEYPNEKQRYAVANSYWENKGRDSVKDGDFDNIKEIKGYHIPPMDRFDKTIPRGNKTYYVRRDASTEGQEVWVMYYDYDKDITYVNTKYISLNEIKDSIKDADIDKSMLERVANKYNAKVSIGKKGGVPEVRFIPNDNSITENLGFSFQFAKNIENEIASSGWSNQGWENNVLKFRNYTLRDSIKKILGDNAKIIDSDLDSIADKLKQWINNNHWVQNKGLEYFLSSNMTPKSINSFIAEQSTRDLTYDDYNYIVEKATGYKYDSRNERFINLKKPSNIISFDSIIDEDIDSLSAEEKQAIEDYKKAISETKDVKLLELYSHILREEIEHLRELNEAKDNDSVRDEDNRAELEQELNDLQAEKKKISDLHIHYLETDFQKADKYGSMLEQINMQIRDIKRKLKIADSVKDSDADELYRYSWDRTDDKIIEKLLSLTNKSTFWDDVRKFTNNIHSDNMIRRWERLSDVRYGQLH